MDDQTDHRREQNPPGDTKGPTLCIPVWIQKWKPKWQKCDKTGEENRPVKLTMKWKGKKTRCGLTDMSELGDSSSHNLCLFIHVPFLSSYFLCAPLSFLFVCSLSSVPSVSPSSSPVMPQMAFVKDGEITEDFYLSDPAVPFIFLSQLDLSHTSASYCCLAASSRPRARLVLSELLSSLPWASAGKNSTSRICISSVFHCCRVRLHLRARIRPDAVCI